MEHVLGPARASVAALALAALGVGLVLGAWLGVALQRSRSRTALKRRFRRARVAETEAVRTLERLGFEVLDAQLEGVAHVLLDGARLECPIRADYLVRRRGRLALVEVKSGADTRVAAEHETRRQLLEYWLAFDRLPLYHLDALSGALTEVGFAYGDGARPWLSAGAAISVVVAVAAALAGWMSFELGLLSR